MEGRVGTDGGNGIAVVKIKMSRVASSWLASPRRGWNVACCGKTLEMALPFRA
jgi:hypothetical protein